ncbi:hypothetical protein [Catalinimonas niigatensis]|uniref:hypothetical protein n=1 Tax=Catalinimonas niigatensis TaxID=1397264 RepID=UPI0026666C9B|nr:hypothetical protein [Catalinimonas niigatensis]WPP49644.1 hypothetical protein PZB72_23500 [Catalinimonas niigatensis]
MERYVQLNEGETGTFYIGDSKTGIIYAATAPLSVLKKQYPLQLGLGTLGIVPVIIGAVAAVTPAVIGAVNASKNRKAAEKEAARQQEMLKQQAYMQTSAQESQQQMIMTIGGLGLAGFLLFMLLK